MSKYRLTLNNYHSVHSADIRLDGITVLSGENGCGKSTLSRWLYYMVDISASFDKYVLDIYRSDVNLLIMEVRRALREISSLMADANDEYEKVGLERLRVRQINSIDEIADIAKKTRSFISDSTRAIRKFLDSATIQTEKKKRVLRYVNRNDATNAIETADDFSDYANSRLDSFAEKLRKNLSDRDLSLAYQFVKIEFDDDDKIPADLHIYEDGVDVIHGNRIGTLFGVERCIYIDTPMALNTSEESSEIVAWDRLKRMMVTRNPNAEVVGNDTLIRRISRLINGRVDVSDSVFDADELYYVRKDGLAIPLYKVATGMKTFSYIMQLLKNGYLDNKTMMLIDEPEAHLHPQWIVEYARLLVMLHKILGVKIMLASHNPDMVAALQAIAKKENVADRLNFYLGTKNTDNELMYDFEALGNDIEPVFESFNIALTRISQYGDISD